MIARATAFARWPAIAMVALAGVALAQYPPSGWRQSRPPAQEPQDQAVPEIDGGQFAGLQWTFVRIRYSAWTMRGRYGGSLYDEPWAIDYSAAEQNLTRRIRSVTAIDAAEPIVLQLEDPRLFLYPWIYIVEPGNLRLKDTEVPILREFLLRGGTLTFDDFHGPIEWSNLEREMKRVFPERAIVELTPDHPIFSCFYKLDHFPQTPGLGSFLSGRTWEKGGFVARLRAILDDNGRPMVLINWNTDMGDGVEWSNVAEYPGYVKYTAEAYRMMINEIIYALTH
ncbi:MAG TPA: DUF4159 domain-containing protein [Vicinamibacterales bacterium]|nr:DUF4159 domain-containing protein [Vicinamibacterales bacterium]